VTATQVGAPTVAEFQTVNNSLTSHIQDKNNPHSVTTEQIGAAAARKGAQNVWVQATKPIGLVIDDLWFNTATGDWFYWDGAVWTNALAAGNRVFYCDVDLLRNYELNPDTLAIMTYASSPFTAPYGIGGMHNRLFHCDMNDRIYELHPDTFATISSVRSPGVVPRGIGGTINRLFYCDRNTDWNYELNPDTLAAISHAASPGGEPDGIGGMYNKLFHCDMALDRNYELNPDTLAVVLSEVSPSIVPSGIGGTFNRLLHCDRHIDRIYHLNPINLVIISHVAAPTTQASGIGGFK